jgi:hypothetical protein
MVQQDQQQDPEQPPQEQPQQLIQPDPPGNVPPKPRKTHKTAEIIANLKTWPLLARLKLNQTIESSNMDRDRQCFNNVVNPALFPEAPSSNASFVTLNSVDYTILRSPVASSFIQFFLSFVVEKNCQSL